MAWEISISQDGWDEIYQKLNEMDDSQLIDALVSDKSAKVDDEDLTIEWFDQAKEPLKELPHDVLVDACFDLIQENNTCDNGGYAYWIDVEGYHKVFLND